MPMSRPLGLGQGPSVRQTFGDGTERKTTESPQEREVGPGDGTRDLRLLCVDDGL